MEPHFLNVVYKYWNFAHFSAGKNAFRAISLTNPLFAIIIYVLFPAKNTDKIFNIGLRKGEDRINPLNFRGLH
jgi:hypothetical protein